MYDHIHDHDHHHDSRWDNKKNATEKYPIEMSGEHLFQWLYQPPRELLKKVIRRQSQRIAVLSLLAEEMRTGSVGAGALLFSTQNAFLSSLTGVHTGAMRIIVAAKMQFAEYISDVLVGPYIQSTHVRRRLDASSRKMESH